MPGPQEGQRKKAGRNDRWETWPEVEEGPGDRNQERGSVAGTKGLTLENRTHQGPTPSVGNGKTWGADLDDERRGRTDRAAIAAVPGRGRVGGTPTPGPGGAPVPCVCWSGETARY